MKICVPQNTTGPAHNASGTAEARKLNRLGIGPGTSA